MSKSVPKTLHRLADVVKMADKGYVLSTLKNVDDETYKEFAKWYPSREAMTLLHYTISLSDSASSLFLIQKLPFSLLISTNANNSTPLHLAAKNGLVEVCNALFAAIINYEKGKTALSIINGCDMSILSYSIRNKMDEFVSKILPHLSKQCVEFEMKRMNPDDKTELHGRDLDIYKMLADQVTSKELPELTNLADQNTSSAISLPDDKNSETSIKPEADNVDLMAVITNHYGSLDFMH